MSHVPHDLAEEFPMQKAAIQALKAADPHFCKLAERYHTVNRSIHRVETNVEPMDDVFALELRRDRLRLKDEIAGLLKGHLQETA